MVPLATMGLFFISLGAFSRKVKNEIHKRDGYICVSCGASFPIEASHNNHDKSNPDYNKASNGDTRCPSCHLDEHIDKAGRNGLSQSANNWAIRQLIKRS